MQTFDWIVVGNGLVGAATSYELAHQGFSVLLIDQALDPPSSTRFSYGGIAHWSGKNNRSRRLCQEGIVKHRQLAEELGTDTQFRELNLLLTVFPEDDIEALTTQFASFETPPQFVSAQEAQDLEPLLQGDTLAGALVVRHGHVSPPALIQAYNQAFQRLGGTRMIASVTGLVRIKDRVTGVITAEQAYPAQNVLVAAGAMGRQLLRTINLKVPLYYSHAELIETPPVPNLSLRTLIMPAVTQRFALESQASRPEVDALWDEPGHEVTPPILDGGAIQFCDHHFCLGQISRTLTGTEDPIDGATSERKIRAAVGQVLPALADLPGQWHRCLVSFSRDDLPLVGPLPGITGLHLMAGFNGPFVYAPPVAQRFAQAAASQPDEDLLAMTPGRFAAQ